jgi:flagellar FliL protein
MKKKLLIVAPVLLLVVAAAAYKLVLAPKPATAKPKIAGELMQLADPFVINLAGGRYAKVSVALPPPPREPTSPSRRSPPSAPSSPTS